MRLKNEHVRSEPYRIEETKPEKRDSRGDFKMAKKSRGGRMTSAKKRAAKRAGGRGPVRRRSAGRSIMRT
jgi:hypothetical protein